jgi:acetyltransferase-like isoleucine patch superfamily enzyme
VVPWEKPLTKLYLEQSGVGVLVGVLVSVGVAVGVSVGNGVSVGPSVLVGQGVLVGPRPLPGAAIEREVRNVSTTPWRMDTRWTIGQTWLRKGVING